MVRLNDATDFTNLTIKGKQRNMSVDPKISDLLQCKPISVQGQGRVDIMK